MGLTALLSVVVILGVLENHQAVVGLKCKFSSNWENCDTVEFKDAIDCWDFAKMDELGNTTDDKLWEALQKEAQNIEDKRKKKKSRDGPVDVWMNEDEEKPGVTKIISEACFRLSTLNSITVKNGKEEVRRGVAIRGCIKKEFNQDYVGTQEGGLYLRRPNWAADFCFYDNCNEPIISGAEGWSDEDIRCVEKFCFSTKKNSCNNTKYDYTEDVAGGGDGSSSKDNNSSRTYTNKPWQCFYVVILGVFIWSATAQR